MTNAEHFAPTYTERNDRVYNATLTHTAVFIAFAVIATLICGTVPAIGRIMSDAVSVADIRYTFLSVSELLADAFAESVTELAALALIFVFSFSLLSDAVGRIVCALRGFTFGALLFYVLSATGGDNVIFIHFGASALCSAVIIACCSFSVSVNKQLFRTHHTKNRRSYFKACVADLLILCISCGAICTVNILKLLFTC